MFMKLTSGCATVTWEYKKFLQLPFAFLPKNVAHLNVF